MADTMADWRLFGAHDHLKEATLWWRAYAPRNEIWAQDHCEFCWATFARSGENVWHEGYATQPPYGVSVAEPVALLPAPGAQDDEYITEVVAAAKAAGAAETPPEAPSYDAALEEALDMLPLPLAGSEPPKVERVAWICPQCFDDFHALFGWTVANQEG
jgi:hypothetical protein